eukprot:1158727-Pelagomonas_calceolata.AAC.5
MRRQLVHMKWAPPRPLEPEAAGALEVGAHPDPWSLSLTHVADALKSGRHPDPEPYSEVSLFFSDVCGYTNICSSLQPPQVMDMLHRLYSRFDALAQELCLFKGDPHEVERVLQVCKETSMWPTAGRAMDVMEPFTQFLDSF